MNSRIVPLFVVLVVASLLYSMAGALYAYAGRHVAGLALVGAVLALALGGRTATWWTKHGSALSMLATLSVVTLLLLGAQQARWAVIRAQAWDSAQLVNYAVITEGRSDQLIDVPLKAGLSMSGIRDHDESQTYRDWLVTWRPE